MIRQPKRDERRQIIPLIELIMQDMELPILEHTSPEMLYAMLEEAMLDDQFRYGLKNTLVYIHEGKVAGAIFGYHGHLEDAIDDPFHRLYEDYNTPHQLPLYEDKETMPGEWYIDILAVYPKYRRIGIGRKLLVEVENLARQQGATKIALNCEKDNTKAYDKAVAEVKTTYATKPEERYKQMIAAEKIVMDDAVVAPIYQASQSYLLAENVDGFEVLPFGRTINLRQASVK